MSSSSVTSSSCEAFVELYWGCVYSGNMITLDSMVDEDIQAEGRCFQQRRTFAGKENFIERANRLHQSVDKVVRTSREYITTIEDIQLRETTVVVECQQHLLLKNSPTDNVDDNEEPLKTTAFYSKGTQHFTLRRVDNRWILVRYSYDETDDSPAAMVPTATVSSQKGYFSGCTVA